MIRGIDTQMMITRSSDFVRDVSNMEKQPEVAQENLAALVKNESTQDQSRVLATTEAEMDEIRPEEEGSSGNEYEGSGEGQEHEEDEDEKEQNARMLVPPSDHVIDIKI